jgi:antitoxin component YwqK of YwqJK toxin-antitoxin module
MSRGKLHGESLRLYPDGKKRQVSIFKNGSPESLRRWHANGNLAAEGNFTDGKKSDLWREWDSTGRLRESAQYENGELHGERRFFDSSGTLTRLQKYYRGLPPKGSFPGIPGGIKRPQKN